MEYVVNKTEDLLSRPSRLHGHFSHLSQTVGPYDHIQPHNVYLFWLVQKYAQLGIIPYRINFNNYCTINQGKKRTRIFFLDF